MNEGEIAYALVCLRSGIVLDTLGDTRAERMVGWAAAAPELFRDDQRAIWCSLFARVGGDAQSRFREFVLVSADRVHVLERIGPAGDVALVAVSSADTNLAVVLSAVRRRVAEVEQEGR